MTVVFFVDVSPLSDKDVFDSYFSSLPQFRKEKVLRLKNDKAKKLSLGAWVVLERCAGKFGLSLDAAGFSVLPNGKPYLKKNPELHIGISHSEDIAMCAISDIGIGLDVEYISGFNENVCRRFFGENECKWILDEKNADMKAERFFRIWTLKESYSKLTGKGIGDFRNFEIDVFNGEPNMKKDGMSEDSIRFYEGDIPGYKSAVCLDGESEIHFEKINIDKGHTW